MRAAFTFVVASCLAFVANAAPVFQNRAISLPKCKINAAAFKPGTLPIPTDAVPTYVAIGVGVQNYTCSAAGTYVTAGAVADLWDISCISNIPVMFNNVQNVAYGMYANPRADLTLQGMAGAFSPLGQHYFIAGATAGTISPKFDFTATKKDPNAFIVAKKLGNIASPNGTANVDWLELGNVSGSLSKYVFRLDTKAGQPPASCTPGSPLISVKYAAKYWFLG